MSLREEFNKSFKKRFKLNVYYLISLGYLAWMFGKGIAFLFVR